jgi:hypothetical protein
MKVNKFTLYPKLYFDCVCVVMRYNLLTQMNLLKNATKAYILLLTDVVALGDH